MHLLRRFCVQNYIVWTSGSSPLQFAVHEVQGVQELQKNLNYSASGHLPYDKSYAVVLLDKYLQPSVSRM